MFDQILDNYRKAAESTIQFQQEMLRNLTQQWPQMSGVPTPGAASTEQAQTAWKGAASTAQAQAARQKWSETITDMLNKHRETLDSQYRAGIQTIEDAFRVGEAKDPEQVRKLTEELWRQSFDSLKTTVESQMREFQAAMEKWVEVASKGASPGKK
jgi:hypothetical protein